MTISMLHEFCRSTTGEDSIDGLSVKIVCLQLQAMGLLVKGHVNPTVEKTLPKRFKPWLAETYRLLREHGYLVDKETVCSSCFCQPQPPTLADLWQHWQEACSNLGDGTPYQAQLQLLATTLRALPDILTGNALATDVIFAGGSMALVEKIYNNNPQADYYNDLLVAVLQASLDEGLDDASQRRFRILEIGAGTGGTSARVFTGLKDYQPYIAEYCYTDVSEHFLQYGRERYAKDNPYLSFNLFDVEAFPALQSGIDIQAYDVVIASNVLHATRDIQRTLAHCKHLLKPQGLLLINELSGNSIFAHLTFGFLDGWWLYEDSELRLPGCPGLSSQSWTKALGETGFGSVFLASADNEDLGQQILVAQSDGELLNRSDAVKNVLDSINGAATSPEQQNISQENTSQVLDSEASSIEVDLFIRQQLIQCLSQNLGIQTQEISLKTSFADYGLDSLSAIQLVKAINLALNIVLKTVHLFDHSTVTRLTHFIQSRFTITLPPTVEQKLATDALVHADVTNLAETNIVETGIAATDIAVIGISCRFAESETPEALWQHLLEGKDLVKKVSRWDLPALYQKAGITESNTCQWGSFLDRLDRFDPEFFNISMLEANYMDPQQRIFLEACWSALEDAAYSGESLQQQVCGIYVGCTTSGYQQLIPSPPPAQAMWGNSTAVVPARIAYFLNLQGPAIAVDTACSSSLTAIHLACQSLWNNETSLALAGGVSVQATPDIYIAGQRAKMLSTRGRCFTFDERADGFVPAEGVGVVVLKRLQDAYKARDHVYGVIRGSAMNQDGQSNGITAPCGRAQEALARQVYDRFKIDPADIQMVEAHGTGTRLGDPIEFEALTNTFRHYTENVAFCALGSIKSNIGHATAAAGVAGFIKLLQAMQHRQIPPSLHFEQCNSDIALQGSPFFVNTVAIDWPKPQNKPRQAALSAFGFSGTNVHMVLAEPPELMVEAQSQPAYLIVLSAYSEQQLRQQIEQLLAFVNQSPESHCGDLSMTLLMGRQHFSHRFSCIMPDLVSLQASLRSWLQNPLEKLATQVQVSCLTDLELRESSTNTEALERAVARLRQSLVTADTRFFDYMQEIAELYHSGAPVAVDSLFTGLGYRRLSLPSYPFLRQRCWVPESTSVAHLANQNLAAKTLHPLLHSNTSSLKAHRFSSVFSGHEFFLADHLIQGQAVLPGVAYLEMAMAAVKHSLSQAPLSINHIVFVQPFVVTKEKNTLHLCLLEKSAQCLTFTIYSHADLPQSQNAIIHCKGEIQLSDQSENSITHQSNAADKSAEFLSQKQAHCSAIQVMGAQCYERFAVMGIVFGPRMQGLSSLYLGEKQSNGARQVLAELVLPDGLKDSSHPFIMHPTLLDSAIQASIGVNFEPSMQTTAAYVPFTINTLRQFHYEVHSEDQGDIHWAWVRESSNMTNGTGQSSLLSVDVDLLDAQGRSRIEVRGLSFRPKSKDSDTKPKTSLFVQQWQMPLVLPPVPVNAHDNQQNNDLRASHHVILFAGVADALVSKVQQALTATDCHVLPLGQGTIADQYQTAAAALMQWLQRLSTALSQETLVQLLVPHNEEGQVFAGLWGMLKTATQELLPFRIQLLRLSSTTKSTPLINLLAEQMTQFSSQVLYLNGDSYQSLSWQPLSLNNGNAAAQPPWQEQGVYVISGGFGQLGLNIAQDIKTHAPCAQVYLLGRSTLTPIQEQTLAEGQGTFHYCKLDISEASALNARLQGIYSRHARLDGIIHCAGVIQDSFIVRKTTAQLEQVMAPKVAGLFNLDNASRNIPLDFFICFAAGAGVFGNVGQADYAAANGFMDTFMHYRQSLVQQGVRQGKSLSIDWPLWQAGGMQMDAAVQIRLHQRYGVLPMDSESGLAAFYQCLQSEQTQVLVLHGEQNKLHAFLERETLVQETVQEIISAPKTANEQQHFALKSDLLQSNTSELAVQGVLKSLLSPLIAKPVEDINAMTSLERYGMDSLMVMNLTEQLEKKLDTILPKTLFFEFHTLEALSLYLLEHHAQAVNAHILAQPEAATLIQGDTESVDLSEQAHSVWESPKSEPEQEKPQFHVKERNDDPIAIVGLAGRYPQAQTMEAFWKNLCAGQDCVTEIPPERWDHSQYYDPHKGKPGKTYGKWGGFLKNIDMFDPLFFNISPLEAQAIDPQERLFLQCVYHCLEDAAYTRQNIGKDVGVFVGVMYEEYQLYGAQETQKGNPMTLNGSAASIANRVSYFFDFQGPSVALDSMCSSSITALHFALNSIRQGDCQQAIVGGVNLNLHPNKFLILGQGQFCSSRGRCESFGEGGDGYVPGEGVGALLLKPLSRAVADGDNIYAQIRGVAINHGGKSNGYSAPDPRAQGEVIAQALLRAGVEPNRVSYIEAHGTGTALGDPIEIAGLNKAFSGGSVGTSLALQSCAIGSVKSNIGHCESAAGIAAISKVLLQMKHAQLVPSLHADTVNPNIDFAKSAFKVQQTLTDWKQTTGVIDGEKALLPRIAGISSFGAGGANAHVILEQYTRPEIAPTALEAEVLVLLSAVSENQLRQQAKSLLHALQNEAASTPLRDIAFTLQMGREAMLKRLGLLVNNRVELQTKLQVFLDGQFNHQDIIYGEDQSKAKSKVNGDAGDPASALALLGTGNESKILINGCFQRRDFSRLLQCWVQGFEVDWSALYANDSTKPQRTSLPLYPFLEQRCWFQPSVDGQAPSAQTTDYIHPLVHRNCSNFQSIRFSSEFQGSEPFLADHQLKQQALLPAVAYLEMARLASLQALQRSVDTPMVLEHISWQQPLFVGNTPQKVYITLTPPVDQSIHFRIFSGDLRLHSQGRVSLTIPDYHNESIDIPALELRCKKGYISAVQCYKRLADMGLDYGPAHQALQHIYLGERSVLAQIKLPSKVKADAEQFFLHPSMMDAALHALIGFTSDTTSQPLIPFSVDRIDIWKPTPSHLWAYIELVSQSSAGECKFAIDLIDKQGQLCVRITGFNSRPIPSIDIESDIVELGESPLPTVPPANMHGNLLLTPHWQVSSSPFTPDRTMTGRDKRTGYAVVFGGDSKQRAQLSAVFDNVRFVDIEPQATIEHLTSHFRTQILHDIVWIAPLEDVSLAINEGLITAQHQGVKHVWRLLKALLVLEYDKRDLTCTFVTHQAVATYSGENLSATHASVHGLCGSLAKEYAKWQIRVVDLPDVDPSGQSLSWAELMSLNSDPMGNVMAYRKGQWLHQTLLPTVITPTKKSPYRHGGVYVVVGGAGGLGCAWSEVMIRRYQARIVWLGRRSKDDSIQAKLDHLATLGPRPVYLSVDAGDLGAMQRAYHQIQQSHGTVHGVVHSALVLDDQSLAQMPETVFTKSLAAKIDVSVRLAQVFDGNTLDFVLFFSSFNAFSKSPGQSNYSAGCTFKDSFADQLNVHWPCAVKTINWGYWGEVGIVASPTYRQRMDQAGLASINIEEGMAALDLLLSGQQSQLALLKTSRPFSWPPIDETQLCTGYLPNREAFPKAQFIDNVGTLSIAIEQQWQSHQGMENLLAKKLLVALDRMGLFGKIEGQALLHSRYHAWFSHSLGLLAVQGLLIAKGDTYHVSATCTKSWARQVENEWQVAKRQWQGGSLANHALLVDACIQQLADILLGKQTATAVLFPESSMDWVEGIYKHNPIADYYNEALANVLISHLNLLIAQAPERQIRILEIGAGTGGTTGIVLERISAYRSNIAEYCYSDVSPAFLLHAKTHFLPENPFLRCALFNVEQGLDGQDIDPNAYDIVIASNVLHATQDIRQTLKNVKATMSCHGALILNEMRDNNVFAHMTFGLLEGWWRAQDHALRIAGSPILAPHQWLAVLAAEGFYHGQSTVEKNLGQEIYLAYSDGVVIQSRTVKKSDTAQGLKMPTLAVANADMSHQKVAVDTVNHHQLRDNSMVFIRELFASTLKISPEQIDDTTPFIEYGVDSIVVVNLTNVFRETFPDITSTLFFEYPNIEALVEYFLDSYNDVLIEHLSPSADQHLELENASVIEVPYAQSDVVKLEMIEQTQNTAQSSSASASGAQNIAIIGLSGLYPGAANSAALWQRLQAGDSCISPIPADRWRWQDYFSEAKGDAGRSYSKWGAFLQNVDTFDPLFFKISPKEAEQMDPQERLFLQEAYAAIEDAGYVPASLSESKQVGVYVGVMNGDYANGANFWSIANRVSYQLDFHGPSMAVDSACASSLTAVHLACESLATGSIDCAIAGGVNLILAASHHLQLSDMSMLSSNDQCRAYATDADGFVDGEAVVAIVLKPLARAVEDGDHIYGVIKGSAVNSGGKTNGYTVPNPTAQAAVITQAIKRSGVHPRTITYVEGHGTGTALGDPIEVAGLTRAYAAYTSDSQFCALGSIKSNMGHCESAAGLVGLSKILMQFTHGQLAPSLHVATPNPEIKLEHSPFVLQQQLSDWPRPRLDLDGVLKEYPRRAGLSSFGAGGTNIHMIVEEHCQTQVQQTEHLNDVETLGQRRVPAMVVLSARTVEQLVAKVRDLQVFIKSASLTDADLVALAYTLQVGREAMKVRLAFLADSINTVILGLEQYLGGQSVTHQSSATVVLWSAEVKRHQSNPRPTQGFETWYAQADYARCLQSWTQGEPVAWQILYPAGEKPIRISLPTYPFEKERYWLDGPSNTAPLGVAEHQSQVSVADQNQHPTHASQLLFYRPSWQAIDIDTIDIGHESAGGENHYMLFCDQGSDGALLNADMFPESQWIALSVKGDSLAAKFEYLTLQLFTQIKSLCTIHHAPSDQLLVQVVLAQGSDQQCLAGVRGLLRSAEQEFVQLRCQLVQIEVCSADMPEVSLTKVITALALRAWQYIVVTHKGQALVQHWDTLAEAKEQPQSRVELARKDGVYLITGGAKGVGLLLTKHLFQLAPKSQVIVCGRTPQAKNALALLPPNCEYLQLDVSDLTAVQTTVEYIVQKYGRLHGVIHSAGVLRDRFMVNKPDDDIFAVLSPKVYGLENLDLATQKLMLDYFLLFSSVAGVTGNVGQADYSAANAFMDDFATMRAQDVNSGQRSGLTLAINWPLWQDGGMAMSAADQSQLRQRLGVLPLSTDLGMKALTQALALAVEATQILLVAGELGPSFKNKVDTLLQPPKTVTDNHPSEVTIADNEALQYSVVNQLKQIFGTVSKLTIDKIDADEPLESYGIDSLMITSLNEQLYKVFGEMPKTLFFQYQSLRELASYLVANHPQSCGRWCDLKPAPLKGPSQMTPPMTIVDRPHQAPEQRQTEQQPIAIIGMHGRYPDAPNLAVYWQNLSQGRCSITEIPADRWPLERFFEADVDTALAQGKSYSKWGGFIQGHSEFDPLFFNMSPREALCMDPQERVFLQSCWLVLEDAGYTRQRIANECQRRVGVFAGITKTGFDHYGLQVFQQDQALYPYTSFSSVANRVSYLLDLCGPSMPIDTMCSSSLTAIHQACEYLRRGDCAIAIAGGVNLYLHPSSYVGLSAKRMLSQEGLCKSFGEGGDGFVPGEGVGTVLLKPLANAQADGDYIHALIRASKINHGGKTNGYTVPNPQAQADVIHSALRAAGVKADQLSYIEAHGTGTALGDPLEISGLQQAFERSLKENKEQANEPRDSLNPPQPQFCAIGSVKSNIGHLEAAAGIAGLSKIVLQMQHGYLVPSLHAEVENPNIAFAQTHFHVQRELAPWQTQGQQPRLAGLSSFGAGGANAHLIIEQYTEETNADSPVLAEPALVLLSAKSHEQLKTYVASLLVAIDNLPLPSDASMQHNTLADIAYTLQIGREAMPHRLALIVDTLPMLVEKLSAYQRDEQNIPDCFSATVARQNDVRILFADEQDLSLLLRKWLAQRQNHKLAKLWLKGVPIDWRAAHTHRQPHTLRLPTYPFAREVIWFSEQQLLPQLNHITPLNSGARLHPLLHENTSTLNGLNFSSRFDGSEFYLRDHVVQGQLVLPGVAYLEMVYQAVQISAGKHESIVLEDHIWAQPIIIEHAQARQVHVRLKVAKNGAIAYEVFSTRTLAGVNKNPIGEAVIEHAKGYAYKTTQVLPPENIALEKIQAQGQRAILEAKDCYSAFGLLGLEYGEAFQVLQTVYVGEDAVLGKLVLPARFLPTLQAFELHPSMLDGAIQTLIGFIWGTDTSNTYIPFALDSISVHHKLKENLWVWARLVEPDAGKSKGMHRFNIDLCDEHGKVLVALRGLSTRIVKLDTRDSKTAVLAATTVPSKTVLSTAIPSTKTRAELYQWDWQDQALQECPEHLTVEENKAHWLVLCTPHHVDEEELRLSLPDSHCFVLQAQGDHQRSYVDTAERLLVILQSVLKQTKTERSLLQFVIGADSSSFLEGLKGMLLSAAYENPLLQVQVIEHRQVFAVHNDFQTFITRLVSEYLYGQSLHVRYQDKQRQVGRWQGLETGKLTNLVPWKHGGRYLIVGGAGGLGLIFAREIAHHAKDGHLIICGRRPLNDELSAQLQALPIKVDHHTLEVTDTTACEVLCTQIVQRYGDINGIIHSAGITDDRFMQQTNTDQLQRVLAPKVAGLVNIDQAYGDRPLDFLVCFSSLAGSLGNLGQGGYSAANGFMDHYADHRNRLVEQGRRCGMSLSIAWPLWQDGGMQVNQAMLKEKFQSQGLERLSSHAGIAAFYQSLAAQSAHVLVIAGNKPSIDQLMTRACLSTPIGSAEPEQSVQIQPNSNDKQRFLDMVEKIAQGELTPAQLHEILIVESRSQ